MTRKPSELTAQEKFELARRYRKGEPVEDLAAYFDVNKKRVSEIVRDLGYEIRGRGRPRQNTP